MPSSSRSTISKTGSAASACVRWTDEQLGRVLDALDAGPNADNTIVVLFADHGSHLGEKKRWSKFSLWEQSYARSPDHFFSR
ncbi:MAG: sulfatase-like hydrolase/transferase [Verrucomicrobiales bacterium]|jgi:arylsulfatase A-like enzyme|nr:sulfatase-like hydrolase/transferase [Verrucomicrobiales bacterium]